MSKVSVVMPLYNGEKYLPEAIECTLNQTFEDFEFIIVNEYGSSEAASEILSRYAALDARIKIIQNTERLGIAESLNAGIRAAQGEYIARVDADDPSYEERFEKQVEFLDANSDVFLCGALQRSLTPNSIEIQVVPCEREDLKAALLFGCEITHSLVMMRRADIVANDWFYSNEFLSEDYALWASLLHKAVFVNLPVVLGDHRWGYGNISIDRGESFAQDVCLTSARALEPLGINMEDWDMRLLGGWRTIPTQYARRDPKNFLDGGCAFLSAIEDANTDLNLFERGAFHNMLIRRWTQWICPAAGASPNSYPEKRFTA
jgi:glycosyltransferase involved in cell wall biosynthesis